MTDQPAFSTQVVHSNERIVIEPPGPSWHYLGSKERDHREKRRELEEIKASIIRHVDGVSQSNVVVAWDTDTCCTHCKEPVALGCGTGGVPYCCDEAQAEWMASGGVIPE